MSLNDLQIGQGDVLSVEALEEARLAHAAARVRMEREHVYDGQGQLVHPTPRWATATAYLAISGEATLREREGVLTPRWCIGFSRDPRIVDTATIEWELAAKGPQIIHVGLEWRESSFAYSFKEEIRFDARGGDGRGRLFFSTLGGVDFSPGDVTEGISGILLVVRAL